MPRSAFLLPWFAAAALACAPSPTPPERIVLVVVDTLRADHLGPYGGTLATPHMDALAARGQIFAGATSSFHQTSMSMGALFTGRTPSLETGDPARPLPWSHASFCGMARFRTPDDRDCLPAGLATLAEDLAQAGWWTAGVTANPFLFEPYGYDQGFAAWVEVGDLPGGMLRTQSDRRDAESRDGRFVNDAVRALLEGRPSDRFFLYVHYLDAHDWILRGYSYAKGVERQDVFVGELFAMLEKEGLLEGTTIVLTSDHGETLGEPHPVKSRGTHLGNPSFEPVLRVPLIVAPPAFGDVQAPVRGVDLRGMIRELAGLSPLEGEAPRDEVFFSEATYQVLRRDGMKSLWPRSGAPPLLFDLAADPGETRDIADARRDVLDRHRARLLELTSELGTRSGERAKLRAEDAERLRALGYLE